MRDLFDRVLSDAVLSDERLTATSKLLYMRMRNSKKMTQAEYSRVFNMPRSTVSDALRQLAAAEWVYSYREPETGRRIHVDWMPLALETPMAREIEFLVDTAPRRGEQTLGCMLQLIVNDRYVLYNRRFKWLVTPFGTGRMELDFTYPEAKVAIEFQGRQHYEAVEFAGGKDGLKEQQARDRAKMLACRRQNMQLVEIRDTELSYETLVKKLAPVVPLLRPLRDRPVFQTLEALCADYVKWAREWRSTG